MRACNTQCQSVSHTRTKSHQMDRRCSVHHQATTIFAFLLLVLCTGLPHENNTHQQNVCGNALVVQYCVKAYCGKSRQRPTKAIKAPAAAAAAAARPNASCTSQPGLVGLPAAGCWLLPDGWSPLAAQCLCAVCCAPSCSEGSVGSRRVPKGNVHYIQHVPSITVPHL